MLIRALDFAHCSPKKQRRRLWLDVGHTMGLGRSLATAQNKILKDCYLPTLILTNSTWGQQELILIQHKLFDLRRFAPLILVPRALQMDDDGIATRFFLEFALQQPTAALHLLEGD